MFTTGGNTNSVLNIGQMKKEADPGELRIPIVVRDLGAVSGRHLTLDTASGIVAIRIPGGADYEL